jgi:hypothetical protein
VTDTKENDNTLTSVIAAIDLSIEGFDYGVSLLVEAAKRKVRIALFTSRWDNDKREIWQIPEARDLFLRTFDKAYEKEGQSLIDVLSYESRFIIQACRTPEKVVPAPPSVGKVFSWAVDNPEKSNK